MSDVSAKYRKFLWSLVNEIGFKDPERKMRYTDFLKTWDDWAEESKYELELLDWAQKYWWLGFLPSLIVFLYSSTIVSRRVDKKYKWFKVAETSLTRYVERAGGASVEERAAVGAMSEQARSYEH